MHEHKVLFRDFVSNYKKGDYFNKKSNNRLKTIWYDWFCNDSCLFKKTKELGKIICEIKEKKIKYSETFILLKNKETLTGHSLDEIHFKNATTNMVIIIIQIDSTKNTKIIRVFDDINYFVMPIAEFQSKQQLISWFNE